MKYFFDTEFYDNGNRIAPISLGMVCEDGRQLYIEWDNAANVCRESQWLLENVYPHLYLQPGKLLSGDMLQSATVSREAAQSEILKFVAPYSKPEFWAYFAAYDWVVLSQIYGGMLNLPGRFPHHCMDLQQWWKQLGFPDDVKPPKPTDAHNALADALWNQEFYNALEAVQ